MVYQLPAPLLVHWQLDVPLGLIGAALFVQATIRFFTEVLHVKPFLTLDDWTVICQARPQNPQLELSITFICFHDFPSWRFTQDVTVERKLLDLAGHRGETQRDNGLLLAVDDHRHG